jgi:hypothetical protein
MKKYLKNIGLKGHKIISLSGAPTSLGPILRMTDYLGAETLY